MKDGSAADLHGTSGNDYEGHGAKSNHREPAHHGHRKYLQPSGSQQQNALYNTGE
jgi:hypothetical protein